MSKAATIRLNEPKDTTPLYRMSSNVVRAIYAVSVDDTAMNAP
jgi:hypothetical protein